MSKNKNKNKQQSQNQSKPTPVVVKPILTDEQKLEIEMQKEDLEVKNVLPVEQLSPESESKLKETETNADLVKYWIYVKDINKGLESLVNTANSEK
jgi:hypothetical protein